MRITTRSPNLTQRLAELLALRLRAGDLVALDGVLGAGKTCFVQGLARGLGITQVVASPSFVLAKQYPGSPGLLHVDAYRLSGAQEYWDLGLADEADGYVTAVEWAANVADALPEGRIEVVLRDAGGEIRAIELSGPGELLKAFADDVAAEPALEPQP
jgi:tRNA threonylcarbamoyladenosine biosynthesis protein TsaE